MSKKPKKTAVIKEPERPDKPDELTLDGLSQDDPGGARRESFQEYSITLSQVADVVQQLQDKGANESFVVLMFPPPKSLPGSDDEINLQFSVDGDVLGLDWVLLGQRNVEDKLRLVQFIAGKGHTVTERERNDVHFLRVEDGDIAELGIRIASEIYLLEPDAEMGLIVDGFEYDPCPTLGTSGQPEVRQDSTVRKVREALYNCARAMFSNATYILGELDKVEMTDALRTQAEQVCNGLVSTRADIVSELSELDDLAASKHSASEIALRVKRIMGLIRDDVDKMHELVMALDAASEQDRAFSHAYLLVSESATNILNAFLSAAAAADSLRAEAEPIANPALGGTT